MTVSRDCDYQAELELPSPYIYTYYIVSKYAADDQGQVVR